MDLSFGPLSLEIFTSNWYTVKIDSKSHKQSAAAWNNRVYECLLARRDNFVNIERTGTNKVSQSIPISARETPKYVKLNLNTPFILSRKQRQLSLGVSSALCFVSSMQCQLTSLIKC